MIVWIVQVLSIAFLIGSTFFVSGNAQISSLFFWHPTLMGLSFLFFMVQGAFLLVGQFSLFNGIKKLMDTKRKDLVNLHFYVEITAVISLLLGFAAIVYNKILMDRPHFQTWHAVFGLVTVLFTVLSPVMLGLTLHFPKIYQFFGHYTILPSKAKIKTWHRAASVLSFEFGMVTIFLSFWSNFSLASVPTSAVPNMISALVAVAILFPFILFRISPLSLFSKKLNLTGNSGGTGTDVA